MAGTPAEDGFYMPAEWAPHDRCWMSWPCRRELWGEGMLSAKAAYASVARAIAAFEPVTMLARPADVAEARLACGPTVGVSEMPLDDSWFRDNGPTFVVDGRGGLAGVTWNFNAWGARFHPWADDARAAATLLGRLGLPAYAAPLILEGGAIHVDGQGTLLATEECLLNDNRNPELTRQDIEATLAMHLGVRRIVWLGQGLSGDETDGHVDNLACFVRPGVVLLAGSDDPADENFERLRDNARRLSAARDAAGRSLEVVRIPLPPATWLDGRRLPVSYVNFYLANGAVIAPAFGAAEDEAALDILRRLFPDRRVVAVDSAAIAAGGGNIHCITQQQPRP